MDADLSILAERKERGREVGERVSVEKLGHRLGQLSLPVPNPKALTRVP